MQDLYDTNPTKLRYVAKVIDVNQGYTNSTPNDVIYEDMDAYIHGDGIERNKATAAKIFLETSKTSMEELKLAAIVADARYYKILMDKPTKMYCIPIWLSKWTFKDSRKNFKESKRTR